MDSLPKPRNRHLEAAKMYVSYGWKVFPLRPREKTPLSLHGFHDATLDLAQIERWWTEIPDAGIGIATGVGSGIIVLDIDPRNGGDESLAAVRAQYEKWEDTAETLTGGGGRHFYFKHPGGVLPSAKPWPGIDIKSDGGYVAASPSIHPSGLKYVWAIGKDPGTCPPQRAPKWLVDLLTDRKKRLLQEAQKNPDSQVLDSGFIREGGRNDGLASLAGTMQRRGMSPGSIFAALKVENENRCRPPLEEGELWAIVNSIIRYEPNPDETVQGNVATPGFEMGDGACAINGDIPEIQWLLEGWLAKGDCSMLIGPPGIGKSWLALELALAGAAGHDIFGHFDVAPLKVLVIDEENKHEEMIRRIWSLGRAHGIKADEIQGRFFFTVPSQGISFRHRGHAAKLRELVATVRPDIVVMDSLIAISNIADENSATMVRKFFHDELYPLRKICNSAILTIHHTNKQVYQYEPQSQGSGFVRGSIDMLAAPDSAMLLSPSGKAMVLEALKVRAGPNPQPLRIRLVDGTDGGIRPLVMEKVGIVEAEQKTLNETIQDTILLQLASGPLTGPELLDRTLACLPKKTSLRYCQVVIQRMRAAGIIESKKLSSGSVKNYQIVKYKA